MDDQDLKKRFLRLGPTLIWGSTSQGPGIKARYSLLVAVSLFGLRSPFLRPGRTLCSPTCRVAVKNARGSRARKGLFLTATRSGGRHARVAGSRGLCDAIQTRLPSQ